MQNFSSKKKGNYRRSSRKSSVVIIGGVVVVVVIIFLTRNVLGSVLSYVTAPLFNVRVWIAESTGTIPSYIRDRSELMEEIRVLTEEQVLYQDTVERGVVLESENEELRALLGRDEVQARIAAGVVTRPPFIPYDTLLIDAGSRDGITEDAVVYYRDDRAVGFVHRTFADYALVTPFSAPNMETTVYIVGPDIYTTAHGEGDGVVRVSVPQGVEITEGDVVLLPSLSRGILGVIDFIRSTEAQPEQDAYIVLTESIQSLRTVAVAREPQQRISFEEVERLVAEQKESLFVVPVPIDFLVDEGATTTDSVEFDETMTASSSPNI